MVARVASALIVQMGHAYERKDVVRCRLEKRAPNMEDAGPPSAANGPGPPTHFANVLRAEMKVILGEDLPPFDDRQRDQDRSQVLNEEIQAR
jgi:hypothetical protein